MKEWIDLSSKTWSIFYYVSNRDEQSWKKLLPLYYDLTFSQGGLACCNSWGRKESDMTERLN